MEKKTIRLLTIMAEQILLADIFRNSSRRLLPILCVIFKIRRTSKSCGQFINKPLRSIKDTIDYLSIHGQCHYHKFPVTQATECIARYPHEKSDVSLLLNNMNEQQQNENRSILKSIIKCILFLSKQNIAFRGNYEKGFLQDDNINP